MFQVYAGVVGYIHIIVSILSLIFGAWIILTKKGTSIHKKIGYAYAVCMLLVSITALMMYELTGSFTIFHLFAAWGLITVSIGVVVAILRKPAKNWLTYHYYFMYWSVVGVYAALGAELSVRLPSAPFWEMVGISSGLVSIVGTIIYAKKKGDWAKLSDVY